jgi:hypothetical protein
MDAYILHELTSCTLHSLSLSLKFSQINQHAVCDCSFRYLLVKRLAIVDKVNRWCMDYGLCIDLLLGSMIIWPAFHFKKNDLQIVTLRKCQRNKTTEGKENRNFVLLRVIYVVCLRLPFPSVHIRTRKHDNRSKWGGGGVRDTFERCLCI